MKKIYFAPLEGITGYLYRNIHHNFFNYPSLYFAPFVTARQTHSFTSKELRDLLPENNVGLDLIPQVMARSSEHFVWAVREISALGYSVVNLNLGCPMPTVVTRGKGSGMLADLEELERFLDASFEEVANGGPRISIKTRLGKEDLSNAVKIIELYNQYPLYELIIHPRCQKDLYKGSVDMEAFDACLSVTKHDVCYNGDVFRIIDYNNLLARYSDSRNSHLKAVMIGRGMIANPAMAREISGGKGLDKAEMEAFHNALLDVYMEQNFGLSTVLHRMKELWFYWGYMYKDCDKMVHKIRISKTIEEYRRAVHLLFSLARLKPDGGFGGF